MEAEADASSVQGPTQDEFRLGVDLAAAAQMCAFRCANPA